jgi:hypothetical protein
MGWPPYSRNRNWSRHASPWHSPSSSTWVAAASLPQVVPLISFDYSSLKINEYSLFAEFVGSSLSALPCSHACAQSRHEIHRTFLIARSLSEMNKVCKTASRSSICFGHGPVFIAGWLRTLLIKWSTMSLCVFRSWLRQHHTYRHYSTNFAAAKAWRRFRWRSRPVLRNSRRAQRV